MLEVSARLMETVSAFSLDSLDLQVLSYQPTHLLLDFQHAECEEICRRVHWWKASAIQLAVARHVECACIDAFGIHRVVDAAELWSWLVPSGERAP